ATELPEVTVEASKEKLPGERLYPDEGYQSRGATVGSRTETDLKDIPQSISVINNELLRDVPVARINQLADYVAGVEPFASAATPYTNAFFFRGFGSTSATTFNGFRDSGFLTSQSLINLDRIEFLKGPASVLYGGSAGLSGLVNYVSKQPQATPFNEITVGGGSFDRQYTTLDSTGALNEDGSLRYRLTASYDKGGNHKDKYSQDSTFISPYLSWDIGDKTKLDVELIAQDTSFDGRENFLPRHPVSFRLPVETNLGIGGTGNDKKRVARVDFKHQFDNGITFRQGLYVSKVDKFDDFSFQFLGVNPDGETGRRRVRSVPESERDWTSQSELNGVFSTGVLKHELLIGMELRKRKFDYDFFVATANDVDLFNPQKGIQTGPLNGSGEKSGASSRAFYVQDLIDLTHDFKLMLGGRFDEVSQFSRARNAVAAPGRDTKEHAFSPRVALIYQPTPATSNYCSYSESFSPQLGLSRTNDQFEPQEGEQYEVGVKHDLRPDLSLSMSVFEFTRKNALTSDPVDPLFSIAVGEQRSRGFELELNG
ncbi:MAG: TonB-dependent siderophore receptor, partial [Nitrosomonadales bacterium]|nr:TonB-dependent siderophore receptor [Nitrosomonadales bacterium]